MVGVKVSVRVGTIHLGIPERFLRRSTMRKSDIQKKL